MTGHGRARNRNGGFRPMAAIPFVLVLGLVAAACSSGGAD